MPPGDPSLAAGDGHVDGLHAQLYVGRDVPDFMDALMPLACLSVRIAGRRTRLYAGARWRVDAIKSDPVRHGKAGGY